ncbi:hypothetical protein GCM10027446_33200 [Angustibacter peucedani]
MLQPAGARPRRRQRWLLVVVRSLVTALGGGALLGAVWRLLAPLARATVVDGGVYLEGHQELQVAQDGWLTVVLALAGVLVATVQAVRAREPQHLRALLALVALGVAGVVAWRVGEWLGPDSLRHQLAAGSQAPLTPLQLHTPAVPLVGPLLFAITRCLAALFSHPEPR